MTHEAIDSRVCLNDNDVEREYPLEQGINKLTSKIREKLGGQKTPLVVFIAGGSASGKTDVVTSRIKTSKEFTDSVQVISMDDYYKDEDMINRMGINWDDPQAIDWQLIENNLCSLKRGESIEKPNYDMKKSKRIDYQVLEPKEVIIVEGLHAIDDRLKDVPGIRVFIDAGMDARFLRRVIRDIERKGKNPEDIMHYFAEIVEPMHETYVENEKGKADFIIHNEYNAWIETGRFGLHENQIKFKRSFDENNMTVKHHAERLASVKQTDHYYNPNGSLIVRGEMLRIREEDCGNKVLTYKGPIKRGVDYREKDKFECEIGKETAGALEKMFGNEVKEIVKIRTLYSLDGITIAFDKVTKVENGIVTPLPDFIEIRTNKSSRDELQKMKDVIKTLGLDMDSAIKKSYFEM
jgi:uridine kinase